MLKIAFIVTSVYSAVRHNYRNMVNPFNSPNKSNCMVYTLAVCKSDTEDCRNQAIDASKVSKVWKRSKVYAALSSNGRLFPKITFAEPRHIRT